MPDAKRIAVASPVEKEHTENLEHASERHEKGALNREEKP
jgi:hypothetical protein